MRLTIRASLCVVFLCPFTLSAELPKPGKLQFEISFPASTSGSALDGHIMLGIAKAEKPEPRYQLKEEEAQSAQYFGLDVDGLRPGAAATIDQTTLGYPIASLDQLPS